MEKIVVILHVLFPGETSWEELSRAPVASFKECRVVERELHRTLTTMNGLPFFTQCADENSVPSSTTWMQAPANEVETTTTTKKPVKK